MSLRIGCVVGEVSGDKLASELFLELKKHYPDCKLEGIVGPALKRLGAKALFDLEALSVMGFIEPLMRLPKLWMMRRSILNYFLQDPPDVFIGVDAPDFNLGLEHRLRNAGIKTIHYVSPTIWAWRANRIHQIKKSVDLMLTLFPFEAPLYQQHHIPVQYVGHPFADEIPLQLDINQARAQLNLSDHQKIVAILPGSRNKEIKNLAPDFLLAAQYCYEQDKNFMFVLPLVSKAHQDAIEKQLEILGLKLPMIFLIDQTRVALTAADVVLTASGTATLETMLHKKPMVVAYRLNPLMYWIAKQLVKIPYAALPNILANQALVPEHIQYFTAEDLGRAVCEQFHLDQSNRLSEYERLHKLLKNQASEKAAQAVVDLLWRKGVE